MLLYLLIHLMLFTQIKSFSDATDNKYSALCNSIIASVHGWLGYLCRACSSVLTVSSSEVWISEENLLLSLCLSGSGVAGPALSSSCSPPNLRLCRLLDTGGSVAEARPRELKKSFVSLFRSSTKFSLLGSSVTANTT